MLNTNAVEPIDDKGYVIDVNIIFSGVLSRKDIYKKLFSEYTLYTPGFALSELDKYRSVILKKAKKISNEDLQAFTLFIFSKITVVPEYLISDDSYRKAENLVDSIDKKDAPYVALAVELGLSLLTRDKPLCKGLRENGFTKIKLFDEFLEEISSSSD